jgi:sRNA-binding protein
MIDEKKPETTARPTLKLGANIEALKNKFAHLIPKKKTEEVAQAPKPKKKDSPKKNESTNKAALVKKANEVFKQTSEQPKQVKSDVVADKDNNKEELETKAGKKENTEKPEAQKPKKKKKYIQRLSPEKYKEYLEIFGSKYPELFTHPATKLLKLRIDKDLKKDPDLDKEMISSFLTIWCKKIVYLKLHKAGANRYDLEGNITSTISEEEMSQLIKGYHLVRWQQKKPPKKKPLETTVSEENTSQESEQAQEDTKELGAELAASKRIVAAEVEEISSSITEAAESIEAAIKNTNPAKPEKIES